LQSLNLTNNQITDLPAEIEQLIHLQNLYLSDNPLLFIHDKVLSSNNKAFYSNEQINQFKAKQKWKMN